MLSFRVLAITLVFLLTSCYTPSHDKIRFYRLNAKGQQTVLTLVKDAEKPGCHNLFKQSHVHRVAQYGFAHCQVYSEKNCAPESVLQAQWTAKKVKSEAKKKPTEKLTKGTRWVLNKTQNIMIRSWQCTK